MPKQASLLLLLEVSRSAALQIPNKGIWTRQLEQC